MFRTELHNPKHTHIKPGAAACKLATPTLYISANTSQPQELESAGSSCRPKAEKGRKLTQLTPAR